METKVILIGGPPCAGKTTLGRNLAIKLGWTLLSIDDLCVAVKEVTTPESHPGLHLMEKGRHIEYFTNTDTQKLIQDAIDQQAAIWPSLKRVIGNHATFGSPIVIDGSMLNQEMVASLEYNNVKAFWLYVSEEILIQREKLNTEFFGKSSDPEKMFNNFMARSFWYNNQVVEDARKYGSQIIHQDGSQTVAILIEKILSII